MSSKPYPSGTGQSGSSTSKRFQLPALDFSFAPLTEGTDIPPPEPSPMIRDETTRTSDGEDLKEKNTNGSGNGSLAPPNGKSSRPHVSLVTSPTSSTSGTTKLSGEDHLTSPTTSSSRNGTIRRMLSRHKLRSPDVNGEETIAENGGAVSSAQEQQQQQQQQTTTTRPPFSNRPPSSNNNSEVKKSRRVSGWFGKILGGGDKSATPRNRRASMMAPFLTSPSSPEPAPVRPLTENKPKGPPPPKIPELSQLKSQLDTKDGGGLLGDDLFRDIK